MMQQYVAAVKFTISESQQLFR